MFNYDRITLKVPGQGQCCLGNKQFDVPDAHKLYCGHSNDSFYGTFNVSNAIKGVL